MTKKSLQFDPLAVNQAGLTHQSITRTRRTRAYETRKSISTFF